MAEKQLNLFDLLNEPEFILQNEVFPDAESEEIEYKSGQGGLPNSLWPTYSSFVNTSGGIIVLGIVEKKNQILVEGLSDTQINKLQSDFWNQINNKKNVSKNILTNDHVKVFEFEGKKILAINIPQGSRTQKPVFLTENPFGNTYKRNYEGDYKCTDEEVRRMLSDADISIQPDGRILEGYSLEDFDANSLRQYRQLMASSKPGHPWLSLDDKDFLTQLGAFRKDRTSKKEGPTLGGMLMFGKYLSITDVECCPKFFPDYREYLSANPEDRWTDRVYADGTWETNLFQFYRLVWPKLSSRLPKPFQLNAGQRIDETPAHEALREAFVNCLVHADYSAPGNIVIESTLDTFIFKNPGTLLVTLFQYYEGGVSECRNTLIQKMFTMIGSAERAGSGVGKILSGWDSSHWRRPRLFVESKPDRLELYLPMTSTIPEDTLSELRFLFGDLVNSLNKDELMILSTCHIEGEVNNQRLRYLVDQHKTEITKLLKDLCRLGFLIPENKGRWTTYHLNKEGSSKQEGSAIKGNIKEDSIKEGSLNDDSLNEDSSHEGSTKEGSSNKDSLNRDSSNRDSSNRDSSDMKHKLSYFELIDIIKLSCKDYQSIDEISKNLDRTPKYLKDKILPKMIKDGILETLFPKYNPNQKYRIKRS